VTCFVIFSCLMGGAIGFQGREVTPYLPFKRIFSIIVSLGLGKKHFPTQLEFA